MQKNKGLIREYGMSLQKISNSPQLLLVFATRYVNLRTIFNSLMKPEKKKILSFFLKKII